MLAYLYQRRGTDWGECDGVSPGRVRHDLQWDDDRLRASAEGLQFVGLVQVGGIPISPFAERIANLVLTVKGRELLWLLENAFSPGEIRPTCIEALPEKARGELDELVDRFLLR